MSSSRELEVKAISRVEGEGRLYVRVEGDRIEHVELNIYEPPRFFESFLRGREIREVPDITARICCVYPVGYYTTASHAAGNAVATVVKPVLEPFRRVM